MSPLLKTKEVSERLSVNPTTIQRWVKYFNLPCVTNEHGHYFFTEDQVQWLLDIKHQLNEGKKMREVEITIEGKTCKANLGKKERIATEQYEHKLEQVLDRVLFLEQQLSKKADEVVSYQLLKHRSEIDEMMNMLTRLEQRLEKMERTNAASAESELPLVVGGEPKKRWKNFVQMFTL
ncbi:chromosome-anchoring protein RacA [Alkalihalobacillus trypoxylicola]|uniref:Chromosome-anchoring protein RacA n=1 Tax=Alkalihalobacillus trypoxylicola TaxID=519424 RepID=A0A162EHI4_9BACI|nr:chromosome-anchoring protein RacA [Alkalihalobacillus trypoxylicola]KYG32901.1 RacA protein [Alkalihalobacillus trypoxylicola]